jgi:radical SAM protein with 4Fe4S-binding SPASM domain
MKKTIKQALLKYGGYTQARKINARIENYGLRRRYQKLIETGSAPLPDKVIFEPTQRCNLRCKMCYQDRDKMANREELTYEQITDFFDQNPYLQKVSLIGGEIFIRRDIINLIRHLNINHDLVISTNGTLIGVSDINALKQCDRLYSVCISLDGPRDIHESIRQVKGSYDKTIQTIKALSPIIPVTVNLVLQAENRKFIPDIVDLSASLGVKKIKIELERIFSDEAVSLTIADMGLIHTDIPISAKGRFRGYTHAALQKVLLECQERGERYGIGIFFDPPYLLDEIKACYDSNLLKSKKFICQNIHTATIAPNGDVINCMQIRKPFGNILNAPLEEIWNSKEANVFRQQLLINNLTSLCENCPFMSPAPRSIVRQLQSGEFQ